MLTAPNQEWAIDSASDVTHAQQRLRIFSVPDAYTPERLALEVDTSFPSRRVTRVLENLTAIHGGPAASALDVGLSDTGGIPEEQGIERSCIT